jgi:hypothetical protein
MPEGKKARMLPLAKGRERQGDTSRDRCDMCDSPNYLHGNLGTGQ